MQQGNDSFSKGNLVSTIIEGDYDYYRIPPRNLEYQSRLGIETFRGFQRVGVVSTGVSGDLQKLQSTRYGPVRIQVVPPVASLHDLETRSPKSSNGCIAPKVDPPLSICFPPICINRQGISQREDRKSMSDFSPLKLANTTLVWSTPRHVSKEPNTVAIITRPISRSSEGTTPINCQQNTATCDLESFREKLASEGISTKASELITSARRGGSVSNYELSWESGLAGVVNNKLILLDVL